MSTLMLVLYFGFVAWGAVDAYQDRTPRKPWTWRRPDLEWWATKKTSRERARSHVPISGDTAP